jgi:hypothetical protein
MATYHQYSEIVAAYGYRLPPPPPPQASRVGLALLYAAVGVALGTFTGTALAVATLPPDSQMVTGHLAFARSIQSELRIHPIANASHAPVIQIHAANPVASAVPAPAVENQNTLAATPAAPVLLIRQAPAVQPHATVQSASITPVPATPVHTSASAASPVLAPVISTHPAAQASNSGQPQILNLAPVVHAAPAVHAQTIKPEAAVVSTAPFQIASTQPVHVLNLQPIQPAQHIDKQASSVSASDASTPVAAPARPQPPAAPTTAALPSAFLSNGLDDASKPLTFYSEGDATVVSYDAAGDTITTDDGRTFVIGATVSVSHAVSWQDYRENVHYRCDQNGNCSLMRTGVIALNARLN